MPEQQLVEIARALGAEARILIMDEPTASLSDKEVDRLFRVIGDLKSHGVGIIYISHRLEELPQIADRVTALRDGVLVGTRRMDEVSRGDLIRMMVGRELSAVFPKTFVEPGEVVLEVRNLGCRAAGVRDVSSERSGRRDPRAGRTGRRGQDRAGARLVRPDARRHGRGPAPRPARGDRFAAARGRPGNRLRPRRPPPPRRDPRHDDGGQHHARDPPRRLSVRVPRLPPGARHRRAGSSASSGSRPPRSKRAWATSRGETSRRWRWLAGWRRTPRC